MSNSHRVQRFRLFRGTKKRRQAAWYPQGLILEGCGEPLDRLGRKSWPSEAKGNERIKEKWKERKRRQRVFPAREVDDYPTLSATRPLRVCRCGVCYDCVEIPFRFAV